MRLRLKAVCEGSCDLVRVVMIRSWHAHGMIIGQKFGMISDDCGIPF